MQWTGRWAGGGCLDDGGGGVHILHHENALREVKLNLALVGPGHRVGLVKDAVHQLLVGLDPGEGDRDDAPPGVVCERLDKRGLARPRRAVQQQPELVRVCDTPPGSGPPPGCSPGERRRRQADAQPGIANLPVRSLKWPSRCSRRAFCAKKSELNVFSSDNL